MAKSHAGGGQGGAVRRGIMVSAVAVLLAEAAQPALAATSTQTTRTVVTGSYSAQAGNGDTVIYSVPGSTSDGGAIYVGAGASLDAGTDGSSGALLQFSGNSAPYGGAIDIAGGVATVSNTTFTANSGVHGAGIFVSSSGAATITNSIFSANVGDYGPGVDSDGVSAIRASSFTNNQASTSGGAYYNSGHGTLSDNTFTNNSSAIRGGAVYNTDTGSFTSSGDSYTANSAGSEGGAVWNGNGNGQISAATFKGNSAGSTGGAIENTNGATLAVTGSSFDSNTAVNDGGAVDNRNGSATISTSVFSGNRALRGGAVANTTQGSATTLTLSDSNLVQNSASYGGAVYNFASTLNLNVSAAATSTFSGNTADAGTGTYTASSLYFDGGGSLNVHVAAGGLLDLRDPMAGVAGTAALGLNKDGAGTWALGGASVFSSTGTAAATTFNVNAGTLYLDAAGEKSNAERVGSSATVAAGSIALGGSAAQFVLGNGATLVAAGNNSISSAGSIVLADGATLRGGTAADANSDTRTVLGGSTALTLSASAGVQLQGALTLNSVAAADSFTLNANLVDSPAGASPGSVTINGAGSVILTGSNTYSGGTLVAAGTLQAGADQAFSPNSAHTVLQNATLALNGHNQTVAGLSNAGTVTFGAAAAGTVLTVNGNYAGNNGLLVFNTVLGADNALTDRLVVTGDTSGATRVSVNNLGGSGAATLNGIELITVQGVSAGEFVQTGRIVAGAYDYQLARGAGASAGNWYLGSAVTVTTPAVDPTTPVATPATPAVDTVRPEAGAYAANLAAANTLFVTSLDDRLGETVYVDAITGEQKLTSLWLRTSGGRDHAHDHTGQLATRANRYALVLGGDIAQGQSAGNGSWRLGALAGYGYADNRSSATLSGYGAKGKVHGYSAGMYGTWYASGTDEAGLYLDGTLQYSRFDNRVEGEQIAAEHYKSHGPQATLEAGYAFQLAQLAQSSLHLQPTARLAWSGIRADEHTERNGTRVSATGENNVATSLGVKAFWKRDHVDVAKHGDFKPFVEANWLHNTQAYGVNMDGVNVTRAGTADVAEMKLGINGDLSPALRMTILLSQQLGKHGYADTMALAGIKYSF